MIEKGTRIITRVSENGDCHWYRRSISQWVKCEMTTAEIVENTVATGNGYWVDNPEGR